MICHCCQQHKLERSPLYDTDLHSPEGQAAYISAEACYVLGHIAQLHEEHASLLRRLNNIQSFMHSFPSEILSLIFQHACHPPKNFVERFRWDPRSTKVWNPTFHLTLGSVSSHWRQVVLSTPRLWSFVGVNLVSCGTLKKWQEILRVSFDRSAAAPLNLAFFVGYKIDNTPGVLLSPEIDKMLLKNQHRIRSLRLVTDHFAKWTSILSDLSGLTSLSAMGMNIRSAPLSFLPTASLHLDTPWVKTTTLDLTWVSIDICIRLLVGCPNLISFQIAFPSLPKDPHGGPILILTKYVVLKKLEVLSWEFPSHFNSTWNYSFLKYIQVPNLNTLRWSDRWGYKWDPTYASSFLSDLPVAIMNLEFVGARSDSHLLGKNLLQCIRRNSQVKNITVQDCSGDFIKGVLHWLKAIDADAGDGGALVFPDLKTIRIDGCRSSRVTLELPDSEIGALLAAVVINRWTGDYTDLFTVEVDRIDALDWLKPHLDDLINGGLDLVVRHNGTRLVLGSLCNSD